MWRMRIACWIPKSINTHSEYVTLSAFPLQQWLHERSSTLRYTKTACIIGDINHSHVPRIETLSPGHSEVTTDRDVRALGKEKTVKSNV
jgi:predicted peptidase